MTKKNIIIIADYSDETSLSFDELCESCGLSPDYIYELVQYEILQPIGESPEEWLFELAQLERIKTALRLQHDLEINLQGIAIILDLLDELERVREQKELLEKHLLK